MTVWLSVLTVFLGISLVTVILLIKCVSYIDDDHTAQMNLIRENLDALDAKINVLKDWLDESGTMLAKGLDKEHALITELDHEVETLYSMFEKEQIKNHATRVVVQNLISKKGGKKND